MATLLKDTFEEVAKLRSLDVAVVAFTSETSQGEKAQASISLHMTEMDCLNRKHADY